MDVVAHTLINPHFHSGEGVVDVAVLAITFCVVVAALIVIMRKSEL